MVIGSALAWLIWYFQYPNGMDWTNINYYQPSSPGSGGAAAAIAFSLITMALAISAKCSLRQRGRAMPDAYKAAEVLLGSGVNSVCCC